MIDTHCHISCDDYDDINSLILKLVNAGIKKVIVNGYDMKSNLEVLSLVNKYDIVYGALGFHPNDLDSFNDEDITFLEDHINDDKIVAIGEIGLDYHYDGYDKNKQIYAFKKQLDIAKKNKKPIIVHSRDAIQDTYDILSGYSLTGSIHAFSGSVEMAKQFVNLGYYLGVGGVVTYKNGRKLREVLECIDLEYILLETDSPYLTPEPYRGTKNDSSYIPLIASKIAEIKECSFEYVVEITTKNASSLFDF
ncbi:MAG: TatD family hydrolase [Bacilli bacterium]|nr:TatD family hydrolase [Bacilli bacterium]